MQQIDLFIRGIHADIGIQKDFVRNFQRTLQFSDLTNPTDITTDYTYSATLPGTSVNKAIFGYIEQGTQGEVFNPAARYEFLLNVNGVLWLHGDVRLTKISVTAGDLTFSCSFYSKIHEKIVKLGNTDLKQTSVLSDNDYYLHLLDRESMAEFWGATHQFSGMIRYVPCRAGMYQDFQSDKMMVPVFDTTQEPPVFTGYEAADLGSDYDEYATREYRIEFQRPALNIGMLVRGIAGDNGINVDASLMACPYVDNGWMICPQFVTERLNENCYGGFSDYNLTTSATAPGFNLPNMYQISPEPQGIFNGSHIRPDTNCHLVTIEFAVRLTVHTAQAVPGNGANIYLSPNAPANQMALGAKLAGNGVDIMQNEADFIMRTSRYFDSHGEPWRLDDTRRYATYQFPIQGSYPGWEDSDWFPVRFTFSLTPGTHSGIDFLLDFGFKRLVYNYYLDSNYTSGVAGSCDSMKIDIKPITALNNGDLSRVKQNGFIGEALSYSTETTGWSPLYVDTNMILSKELSQRDLLVDITKMTGCIWDIEGDSVSIVTRNRYFENYGIKDWTSKIDRQSAIEFDPLTFDKSRYTMSYSDGQSLLEEQYKSKTGLDYGKQYIDTGLQFNSDEEKMYESKTLNTVMSKGERRIIMRNNQDKFVMVSQTPYEIPMIEKKDNGAPEEGYRYVMDRGLQTLPKGEFVYITQDSSFMDSDGIGGRCWYDVEHYAVAPAIANNIAICTAIPVFSTRRDYASFDFAKSAVSFSGENDTTYDASTALYPRFWSKYIDELYNAENRVMTAWFNLTPEDLLNFSFKDFVIIDNHLYHPNKVMDFDISGESLTKVELIEVHDIDAWVNGQNWSFDVPVGSPFAGTLVNVDSSAAINEIMPEI
jgi:hypothetical protein